MKMKGVAGQAASQLYKEQRSRKRKRTVSGVERSDNRKRVLQFHALG
jgi:hypothetical protein